MAPERALSSVCAPRGGSVVCCQCHVALCSKIYFGKFISLCMIKVANSSLIKCFISGNIWKLQQDVINTGHISIYRVTEVNLSAFVYRLFHDDFSSLVGTNLLNHSPALYTLIVINLVGF